jgi:hypothetical protein
MSRQPSAHPGSARTLGQFASGHVLLVRHAELNEPLVSEE